MNSGSSQQNDAGAFGRRSAGRRWLFRFLAIALASVMAFLISEIVLRLFVADTRSPYIYNEFTGTRLEPGHRFVFNTEGYSSNVINSRGLRDREHSLQKPQNTFRIAILGDSFSEAFQVPQDKTFWSVLERELQSTAKFQDRTVEVINFGVSGFGTIQEWQMLVHYVGDYSPDLVLLAFLPGNDVRNNFRELESDHRRPFAGIVDGNLQLDWSFRDDPVEKRFREFTWSACKDQAIRRSRVIHLLYRVLENRRSGQSTGKEHKPEDSQVNEAGIDSLVFAPPRTDAWRSAWQITDRVLDAMYRESKTMAADFIVVVLNNGVEVAPDPKITSALAQQLHVTDLKEPERRIIASGQRYGFHVISLLEPMQEIARRDHLYFHGFPNTKPGTGHWNEIGHKTAGQLIAKRLAEHWIDRPRDQRSEKP